MVIGGRGRLRCCPAPRPRSRLRRRWPAGCALFQSGCWCHATTRHACLRRPGAGFVSTSTAQGVRNGVARVAATDFTRTNVGLQADAPHDREVRRADRCEGPRERREMHLGSRVEWSAGLVVRIALGFVSAKAGTGSWRGRIGVVKLLRARGGCLGVIRWRAWEAAKSPGELPNEHRSRNTRWRPGELKHLSTRRKRNQPRLPQ